MPIVNRLVAEASQIGLEKVVLRVRSGPEASTTGLDRTLHYALSLDRVGRMRAGTASGQPIRTLTPYQQRVLRLRARGFTDPYEIVRWLTPANTEHGSPFPRGTFTEYDFDERGRLVPVDRPFGENSANLVVGVITNFVDTVPEGMRRVMILGDPSREMGSLAEPECRRIIAALDLAQDLGIPVDWFPVSAGAKIALDSGTENLDWTARVLRRIVEVTQRGGAIHVAVAGVNVGAQSYWNAEATMLMHCKGILVLTPEGSMVLTGKRALELSGGVSGEDNQSIGGIEVMGQNGQAQYVARNLTEACQILLRHHELTYVVPGERFPRRTASADPIDRDVCEARHGSAQRPSDFATLGDIFDPNRNPGRKRAFDIRSVMGAVADADCPALERWQAWRDAEIAVVWEARLGGYPVCLLGIESRPLPRFGFVPLDGTDVWNAGTLFPLSSKKIARAINAASGNRPVVVLANLSGFDGSPESMQRLQLEYGAEIGRAVVNFDGPLIFCVISRYHGGAYVVFSATLNPNLQVSALEGSYASVIGGAPAAAVVLTREVDERVFADGEVKSLQKAMGEATGNQKAQLKLLLETRLATVRSQKLGEVAEYFDRTHSVLRAKEVGSIHHILPPSRLRPYLIAALERGMSALGARLSVMTMGGSEIAQGADSSVLG
jgi:acetyl-CoA carboxylase carboxyltransferase component